MEPLGTRRALDLGMTMPRLVAAALLVLTAAFAAVDTTPAAALVLRIGLADDPDMLDPTLARTYTGWIVFAAFAGAPRVDCWLGIQSQIQRFTSQFPTHRNREFIWAYQGIKSGHQGINSPDQEIL